jgi:hypothetical protein
MSLRSGAYHVTELLSRPGVLAIWPRGGLNRKHRPKQSLYCCYGRLPSDSPDIVDVFTDRCQATHVSSRDRFVATVLHSTISYLVFLIINQKLQPAFLCLHLLLQTCALSVYYISFYNFLTIHDLSLGLQEYGGPLAAGKLKPAGANYIAPSERPDFWHVSLSRCNYSNSAIRATPVYFVLLHI